MAAVQPDAYRTAHGRERWVINKLRALAAWYTKGFENGGQLRVAINTCASIAQLRDLINGFFLEERMPESAGASLPSAAV